MHLGSDTLRFRRLLLALAAFAFAPAEATAADDGCGGSPGLLLELPPCAAIKSTFTVCLTGPDDQPGALFASLGLGPTPTKYGTLCLDFPPLVDLRFTFDGLGRFCFDTELPYDPELVGLILNAQFIVCDPDPGLSNLASIEIVDELAAGDFVSYTQDGELGIHCEEQGGPSCLIEENFATLFPNGVILGDQDGVDGDGEWSIVLTTPDAVAKFLAQTGAIGPLVGDLVDPKTTPAGEFAGELLAAKLNLALDEAGLFDPLKNRDCFALGDLVIAGGVDEGLIGISVRDLIAQADLALSGAAILGPQDDSDPAATLGDLSDALKEINRNFDSGGVNLGCLKYR